MRILQLIDSLSTGGAEKLIVETVPLMKKKGLTIDVLLLSDEKTPFYKELEKSKTCNIYSLGKSFYNPYYIIKIIPYLKKYDVIHVHLFPAQYFAVIAKFLAGSKVKMIFTEHSTNNKRLDKRSLRGIERWIYSHYSKIICITEEVKDVLTAKLKLSSSQLSIIPNGINLKHIQNTVVYDRLTEGFSRGDKLIIMVGGFRFEKDQDTVIRALTKLQNSYKLLLVGDGMRRTELENLVRLLRLEDRVFFLGFRNDAISLIKMSDIAILSSHWEGFGLAAVEGMACGIPTIASNVDGLAQVVSGGGVLFEKGNENDLLDKILELENKVYYENIKEACLNRAKEFDISKMIDKLINTYRDLCKK